MANNYFVAGKIYTNKETDFYGTDPSSVVTNRQSDSQPTISWLCTSVTPTFAVFKSNSGRPSGNVRRLRIYRDKNGDYVFPRNRFSGAPVFRSLPSYTLFRDWLNYPTLNSSDENGAFGPDIEFTRGSTATFTGSNGLIQSSAINAPRFDYDPITLAGKGLLIEEARTNLLLQSQGLSSLWSSTGSPTLAYNSVASPDGSTNATRWTRITTALSFTGQAISKAASAITYTFSIYAKANVGSYLALRFQSDSPSGVCSANFDLTNGSISTAAFSTGVFSGASAIIQSVGNGWYRCSVTGTSDATNTLLGAFFSFNSNNTTVAGTDSSASSSGYVYGAQLEAGAFASSYIHTVAATVTRSADVAQITGSNFTSFYNQGEGTFFANGSPSSVFGGGLTRRFFEVSDGTINNKIVVGKFTSTQSRLFIVKDGISQSNILLSTFGAYTKIAATYSNGSNNQATDGVLGIATTGSIPIVNVLNIGSEAILSADAFLNGWISSIAYYPTRLTDDQLQSLTA